MTARKNTKQCGAGAWGSVWATGQAPARHQRDACYPAVSVAAHPAKMLPHIARHAILAYSRPGDVVLDPMCGAGTALIEALRTGRHAIGVDYEPVWAATTATAVHATRRHLPETAGLDSHVIQGDARDLTRLLPNTVGSVDLIVTSPPYGSQTHGRPLTGKRGRTGTRKIPTLHDRYSLDGHVRDKNQLAHRGLDALLTGLEELLSACRAMARPGGILVLATRTWNKHGHVLVDYPALATRAAVRAGWTPRERCVALLARWDGDRLVARHSFFRLHNTRRTRADGHPAHLPVNEDILVFGAP